MPLRTLDASDASQLLVRPHLASQDARDAVLMLGLEQEAALEQNMKPTSEPDQGASVLDASTRSSFFDTFLPFSPVRTIHAQAGAVAQDIARAREMQEDFRAVIDLLASGATSLTAAKAFGHSFNGRQGLDSIFMLRVSSVHSLASLNFRCILTLTSVSSYRTRCKLSTTSSSCRQTSCSGSSRRVSSPSLSPSSRPAPLPTSSS